MNSTVIFHSPELSTTAATVPDTALSTSVKVCVSRSQSTQTVSSHGPTTDVAGTNTSVGVVSQ